MKATPWPSRLVDLVDRRCVASFRWLAIGAVSGAAAVTVVEPPSEASIQPAEIAIRPTTATTSAAEQGREERGLEEALFCLLIVGRMMRAALSAVLKEPRKCFLKIAAPARDAAQGRRCSRVPRRRRSARASWPRDRRRASARRRSGPRRRRPARAPRARRAPEMPLSATTVLPAGTSGISSIGRRDVDRALVEVAVVDPDHLGVGLQRPLELAPRRGPRPGSRGRGRGPRRRATRSSESSRARTISSTASAPLTAAS